jgi:hypothetical protein
VNAMISFANLAQVIRVLVVLRQLHTPLLTVTFAASRPIWGVHTIRNHCAFESHTSQSHLFRFAREYSLGNSVPGTAISILNGLDVRQQLTASHHQRDIVTGITNRLQAKISL